MTKEQIINDIAKDPFFPSYCRYEVFKGKYEYWEDVWHNCIISLYDIEEEKIFEKYNEGEMRFRKYVLGILHNMGFEVFKKQKKRRKRNISQDVWELDEMELSNLVDETEEANELIKYEQRRIKHFSSWTASTEQASNIEDWYERKLFNIYLEEDTTLNKVAIKTKIPKDSVRITLNEFKKKIKQDFKQQEERRRRDEL